MWWYKKSREDSNKYYVSQRKSILGKKWSIVTFERTLQVELGEQKLDFNTMRSTWEKWNNTYWKLIWERNEKGREVARWKLVKSKVKVWQCTFYVHQWHCKCMDAGEGEDLSWQVSLSPFLKLFEMFFILLSITILLH